MASGTIWGTANHPSGKVQVKVEWRSTANVTTNASSVVAELWVARLDGYQTYSQDGAFGLTINGNTSNVTGRSVTLNTANGWQKVHEHTVTVPHNADGTRQVTISATGSMAVTGWTATSLSGTATLDTIPRATQPTISASSFDLGTPITISLPAASPSFTHAVRYSLGGYSTTFYDGPDRSVSYTWPLTLAAQMPNSTSLQGRLWVDTYSGGTHIGTKDLYYTARVPASVVPTAGALTVSDAAGHASKVGGVYVQNQSRASVSVGQSSGIYGSTIKSTVIKVGSVSRAATTATFDLPSAGTVSISATVTDSRGRTHTRTSTITVAAYTPPVITGFTAARVTAAGAADELGSYIRAISSGTATTLANNTLSWTVAWLNGSTWTTLRSGTDTAAPLAWSDNAVVGAGGFAPTSSYRLRVTATDLITTTTREIILPTGSVTMSWGKQGVGIGKVVESGRTLDVGGLIFERGRTLADLYDGQLAYHWPLGLLITTDIPASDPCMWTLTVSLHPYAASSRDAGVAWFRGYSYPTDNAMIATGGKSTVGPRTLHAFIRGGVLCFWLSSAGNYETAYLLLRTQYGLANHRIVSVTDEGLPSSGMSRTATIDARTLGYDTGWQTIPPPAHISGTIQYRTVDGINYVRAAVSRPGGWYADVNTIALGLPGSPVIDAAMQVHRTANVNPSAAVTSAGALVAHFPAAAANYQLTITGSYHTT